MAKAPPSPASAGSAPGSAPGQPQAQGGAGKAPSAPQGGKTPRQTLPSPIDFTVTTGAQKGAARIGIYGPGGIGKTTLAAYLPGAMFVDLEHGTRRMNVARVEGIRDFRALRGVLASIDAQPPTGVQTIVIDSLSVVEEMAKEYVVAERKTEKGLKVESVDAFGWGRGWNFVYDEMMAFFGDLDRIVDRHGMNICCIAHECASLAPNPYGEDFLRYEPHLYAGDKKERSSTRKFFRNWLDELLFVGYDVHATEDGKGVGSGTRTVYTGERPTHIAKSRTNPTEIPFDLTNAAAIWESLGIS